MLRVAMLKYRSLVTFVEKMQVEMVAWDHTARRSSPLTSAWLQFNTWSNKVDM
jgi:hypothetical protein